MSSMQCNCGTQVSCFSNICDVFHEDFHGKIVPSEITIKLVRTPCGMEQESSWITCWWHAIRHTAIVNTHQESSEKPDVRYLAVSSRVADAMPNSQENKMRNIHEIHDSSADRVPTKHRTRWYAHTVIRLHGDERTSSRSRIHWPITLLANNWHVESRFVNSINFVFRLASSHSAISSCTCVMCSGHTHEVWSSNPTKFLFSPSVDIIS